MGFDRATAHKDGKISSVDLSRSADTSTSAPSGRKRNTKLGLPKYLDTALRSN